MKLFRKRRKNNKGFSLVEVICAVAILGVTSTAIGSAMIVSTQNYQRGNAEVDVQKEAQATTNLVGNLLVDALNVTQSTETIDDQVAQVVVIKQEGKEYKLTYLDNKITYEEKNIGTGATVDGCLAENVTNFDLFAATDFDNSDKNVRVDLEVTVGEKTYEASFTNTARNGKGTNIGATQMARINLAESVVVLEPGQNYDFKITVDGMTPDEAGIVWSAPTAYDGSSNAGNTKWADETSLEERTLQVDRNAEGILSFTIKTKVDPSTGLPFDTKQVLVYIRRVNGIQLTDTIKDASGNVPTGNNMYKAGVTYRIDAKALGTELQKRLGLNNYDTDYVSPYYIGFTYEMPGYNADDYMDVRRVEDSDNPYFLFKLKQDMPTGSEIIIKAKAKHPDGGVYNKSGDDYGDVQEEYTIEYVFNPWSTSSDLVRGSDGVRILFDGAFYDQIKHTYGSTSHLKTMNVYEVTLDADGNLQLDQNGDIKPSSITGPIVIVPLTDNGSYTNFNASESKYFHPEKTYILELDIKFLNASNQVVWPLEDTEPNLYSSRHLLGPVELSYGCKENGVGTLNSYKSVSVGTSVEEVLLYDGITWNKLDAFFQIKKEAWVDGRWKEQTNDNLIWVQKGNNSIYYKANQPGIYKITPYLQNYKYTLPDGTSEGTVVYYDLESGGLGELYIIAQ